MIMKHFKIIFLLVSLLFLDTGLYSQNVRVIFVNKTGLPIDSLVANDIYVGCLKPDSASRIITYEHLVFNGGDEIKGAGILHTTRVKSWPDFIFCGTGPYNTVTSGDFLYHIRRRYIDSKHYIFFEPTPQVSQGTQ